MAKRNKLEKFADLLSYDNVLENFDHTKDILTRQEGELINPKGNWSKIIFKNENPITIELACGKGEYTIGMAQMYPNRNFIGLDIKGARIWKGATFAKEKKITNAAFLRTRIEVIEKFFATDEVSEIWISFADPFLKSKKANRRLTSPVFLHYYKNLLKLDGSINLKTDSNILYYYTISILRKRKDLTCIYKNNDIYNIALEYPELEIKTFYEKSHLENGRKIKFIKFAFTD